MLTNLINGFIGGLFGGIITIKIGEFILNKNVKIDFAKVIGILIYAVILSLNYFIMDNFLKVLTTFIAHIILNHILFKERLEKNIVISFIEYINILISEIIVVTILMLVFEIFLKIDIEIIKNTLISNIMILSTNYCIFKVIKNRYKKVIDKIGDNSVLLLSIMSCLVLVCIGSLFYKIDLSRWRLNDSFLLNAIIIVVISYIGITTIIQRINYEKVDKQYKDLAKYSENSSELLEEYSMLNHEYKNQLIIIEGMLKNKDSEASKYVKSLISKKNNIKFKWIKELNNISFQGLKSFMNYKILEMVNDGIKVNVTISKECKEYDLNKLTSNNKDKIYSIIGILLDNAKDAAKESEDKEIIIEAYIKDEEMYIEIANTYKTSVNLEKIKNYGYTTKGSGHGTGLYIINNIIENSKMLDNITNIKDRYFIQILTIKNK